MAKMNDSWDRWFHDIDRLLMQHYRVMAGSGQSLTAQAHKRMRTRLRDLLAKDAEKEDPVVEHKDPLKPLRALSMPKLDALAKSVGVTKDGRWKRETYLQKIHEAQTQEAAT
jgi:ubiquinone/menaquinone biosynthesis C-methylase UbiE